MSQASCDKLLKFASKTGSVTLARMAVELPEPFSSRACFEKCFLRLCKNGQLEIIRLLMSALNVKKGGASRVAFFAEEKDKERLDKNGCAKKGCALPSRLIEEGVKEACIADKLDVVKKLVKYLSHERKCFHVVRFMLDRVVKTGNVPLLACAMRMFDEHQFIGEPSTTLYHLADKGHLPALQWFHALRETDIDASPFRTGSERMGDTYVNVFWRACEAGHLHVCEWLLSLGDQYLSFLTMFPTFEDLLTSIIPKVRDSPATIHWLIQTHASLTGQPPIDVD